MGLGVLDNHKLEHVPGTVFLNEAGSLDLDIAVEAGSHLAAGLKHDKTIILIPQVCHLAWNYVSLFLSPT